jgi:hypothetical protein
MGVVLPVFTPSTMTDAPEGIEVTFKEPPPAPSALALSVPNKPVTATMVNTKFRSARMARSKGEWTLVPPFRVRL